MAVLFQKVTIVRSAKPIRQNINEKLQWFGISLGLFSLRDKDRSSFRIFIELLKAIKNKRGLSSDEIAEKTGLTRGPVVHHLKKLIEAGIVTVDRNVYYLRVETLEQLVSELEKDMKRACSDLREVAKELDAWLNL